MGVTASGIRWPLAICIFVSVLMLSVPITTDFFGLVRGQSLLVLRAVLTLVGYGFHTSLGGQRLFEGKLLIE